MTKHVVVQGECLSKIAKAYGFSDWRIIYNDAQNASFRQKRPNPNLIYPGDEIVIPDKTLKVESDASGKVLKLEVTPPKKTFINLVLQNPDGSPMRSVEYALFVGDTLEARTTKNDGSLEQEIPPDIDSGELMVSKDADDTDPVTLQLAIGHLNPIEQTSGIKGRLLNLGFFFGTVDEILDTETETAIRAFQKNQSIAEDGKITDGLRSRLRNAYGT